jgi:transcription termination factor NusB
MSRRRQREQALQILYAIDIGKGNVCSTRVLLYTLIRRRIQGTSFYNLGREITFSGYRKRC